MTSKEIHDDHAPSGAPPAPAGGFTRREVLELSAGATAMGVMPFGAAQGASRAAVPAELSLTINGAVHRLEIDPRLSLLDLLRERVGLTGAKKGCNQGACGACTVLVNGQRVVSCLTLAIMHEGAEMTTVEGLAGNGELHPVQRAFIEHEGFQCGYCTSGQIMSGVACIAEGHAGSEDDIRFWMSGNICRCGAYPGIVAAVAQAAGEVKP